MAKRVGVASIIQETNTFAANRTTMQDFEIASGFVLMLILNLKE